MIMSEQSEYEEIVDTSFRTLDQAEREYENVDWAVAQLANSGVAGMGQGKLVKKPKPCPKPNIVALRVAEFSLQEKLNSNRSTSKTSPTKTSQHGTPGTAPERPPPVGKSSQPTDGDSTVTNRGVYSSDDYAGVTTTDGVPDGSDPTSSTATDSPVNKTMPIYARPKKPPVKEEPLYDEATAVVFREDGEPLYDEPMFVESDRQRMVPNSTFVEPEPLYADPDEFLADRAQTMTTTQYSAVDGFLYEEAYPVDRNAFPYCAEENSVLSAPL